MYVFQGIVIALSIPVILVLIGVGLWIKDFVTNVKDYKEGK